MGRREEEDKPEVIVDTNILISALIPRNSKLRDVILSEKIRVYAPQYLLEELDKYWNLVMIKAEKKGLSKVLVELLKEELLSKIVFEPEKAYLPKIRSAHEICRQFDEKDTPFIALSLVLDVPILTNDGEIIKNAKLYRAISAAELFRIVDRR